MSSSKITQDPRIDPRLKALLGAMSMPPAKDVASREEMLADQGVSARTVGGDAAHS